MPVGNISAFFRYFGSKARVLFTEFETVIEEIRAALRDVPAEVPVMDAIRSAVVAGGF
jgi:hypothetical protein